MASESRTASEQLFEELCNHHAVTCTRLDEIVGRKQPDYELSFNGQLVVVEVKQIEPNTEDERYAKALKQEGRASQCRNPDRVAKRVRKHIKESRAQLKAYLKRCPNKIPAILVLYDKAKNGYTDSYTIQTAMHGYEQCVLKVGSADHLPTVVDRGFAPRNNKEVRSDKNQHMSAIATLHECWHFDTRERFIALRFYHNQYASHSFDPDLWQGEHVCHMILDEKRGQYQNWVPIAPEGESIPASKGNCDDE